MSLKLRVMEPPPRRKAFCLREVVHDRSFQIRTEIEGHYLLFKHRVQAAED